MIRTFGSSALCVKKLALAVCHSILQRVLKPQFSCIFISFDLVSVLNISAVSRFQASEGERQDYSDDVQKLLEQASEQHMIKYGNIMKHHETS